MASELNSESVQVVKQVPQIIIGGVQIMTKDTMLDQQKRLSLLLWGPMGCGKTTLAATAPGKSLLISFDPDGHDSVQQFVDRGTLDVLDLSATANGIVDQFKKSNDPLGLSKVIEQYDSFIFDSMTNVAYKTLMQGVGTVKGATIERPSPGAYQVRNALALQLTKNALRLTAKYHKHCIIICHEAAPITNDDGVIMFITLMLGGQLPEQSGIDFSETWYMNDTGRERRIAVRPVRMRKPMKTRMFNTDVSPEFVWQYNADKMQGDGLAEWFEQWKANKYNKIPIPASASAPKSKAKPKTT